MNASRIEYVTLECVITGYKHQGTSYNFNCVHRITQLLMC